MKRTFKQKIGLFIIPKLPMSRESFDIIRYELNAFWLRLQYLLNPVAIRKKNKLTKQNNISLNIGAGPFGQKDWINIDMRYYENVDLTLDIRKKWPFKNDTVERIRAEHIFEHLVFKDEAPFFLKESLRILKNGGVLRIIVPDIKKYVHAYFQNDRETWKELGWDIEKHSPVWILNHQFRQDGEHKYGYDFTELSKLVLKNGFSKAIASEFNNSIDEQMGKDRDQHKRYSLYVDCIK